ncbi:MAG: hypothetical protein Q8P76_01800 [bacterium]|nr:hypothetical protein [bacterium]
MLFKFPKNDSEYIWTDHSKHKMLQYRIMPQKIKTILKTHDRKEEGIAPRTVAVMKRNDRPGKAASPKAGEPRPFGRSGREELWVMYQLAVKQANPKSQISNSKTGKIKIISVWRYPGISPKGARIEIPEDTLRYLTKGEL